MLRGEGGLWVVMQAFASSAQGWQVARSIQSGDRLGQSHQQHLPSNWVQHTHLCSQNRMDQGKVANLLCSHQLAAWQENHNWHG